MQATAGVLLQFMAANASLCPSPAAPTCLVASEMSFADSDSPSARITAALRSCGLQAGAAQSVGCRPPWLCPIWQAAGGTSQHPHATAWCAGRAVVPGASRIPAAPARNAQHTALHPACTPASNPQAAQRDHSAHLLCLHHNKPRALRLLLRHLLALNRLRHCAGHQNHRDVTARQWDAGALLHKLAAAQPRDSAAMVWSQGAAKGARNRLHSSPMLPRVHGARLATQQPRASCLSELRAKGQVRDGHIVHLAAANNGTAAACRFNQLLWRSVLANCCGAAGTAAAARKACHVRCRANCHPLLLTRMLNSCARLVRLSRTAADTWSRCVSSCSAWYCATTALSTCASRRDGNVQEVSWPGMQLAARGTRRWGCNGWHIFAPMVDTPVRAPCAPHCRWTAAHARPSQCPGSAHGLRAAARGISAAAVRIAVAETAYGLLSNTRCCHSLPPAAPHTPAGLHASSRRGWVSFPAQLLLQACQRAPAA